MKKILIATIIAIGVIGYSITQLDINAQSGLTGNVVSLNSEVIGETENIDKDRAMELYKAGQPLVFKSGENLYFVLSEAGNIDAKKLVVNAGRQVTIEGSVKSANGFNYILAKSYK